MNQKDRLTTGKLAMELGIPYHRLRYYLTLHKVAPDEVIAGVHVYNRSRLPQIRKIASEHSRLPISECSTKSSPSPNAPPVTDSVLTKLNELFG